MSGRADSPLSVSAARTSSFCTNAAGFCERLCRWTTTPCGLSQSRSAPNCTSFESTSGPQTPVEQHIAGSKIWRIGVFMFYSAVGDCLLQRQVGGAHLQAAVKVRAFLA